MSTTDWTSRTWLGAIGGGMSGSVLVGGSAYGCLLWRMDGHKVPMNVMITGFRVGLVAQIEAGHMVCILQNVTSPNDFKEIKSSGLDWSFGTGVDWDSVLKSGAKLSKELLKMAAKKGAAEAGSWASQEAAKKGVQGLMGDYQMKPKGKAFIMLPTPAALSAGAGLFYEWQTMTKTGGHEAYKYIPPKWRLSGSGETLKLHINGIPEQQNKRLCLLFEDDSWGANETLHFSKSKSTRVTNSTDEVWITVKNGKAYYDGVEGIPLGKLHIIGHTPTGYVSVPSPVSSSYANKSINLQFGISSGRTNLYRWYADDEVSVKVGADGRITSAASTAWKD